jgi:hypothetical protein
MHRRHVTEDDFKNSVSTKQIVQTRERTYTALFVEPHLFITGHFTLGAQVWHYPSLELVRTIKYYSGYVTTIQKFDNTKIIAVSDDADPEQYIAYYNYETGEAVGEKGTINSKVWACISSKTICYYAANELVLHDYDCATKKYNTPIPKEGGLPYLERIVNDSILTISVNYTTHKTTVTQWSTANNIITKTWKKEFSGEVHPLSIFNNTLWFVPSKRKKVQEISLTNGNTIRVARLEGAHRLSHLVDNWYYTVLNEVKHMLIYNAEDNMREVFTYNIGHYLHSLVLNPSKTVMLWCTGDAEIQVHRLREDVTKEEQKFMETLMTTFAYFDLTIKS